MNAETGKYIIAAGVIVVIIGILVYFFHDQLKWFGNLPGDVRAEKGRVKFYFPIVTMIIISVVLTIIINVIRKFF